MPPQGSGGRSLAQPRVPGSSGATMLQAAEEAGLTRQLRLGFPLALSSFKLAAIYIFGSASLGFAWPCSSK